MSGDVHDRDTPRLLCRPHRADLHQWETLPISLNDLLRQTQEADRIELTTEAQVTA
jgi:hypothetical protein